MPPADDTLHIDVYIAERFSGVDGLPPRSDAVVVVTEMPTRWHSSLFLIHGKQKKKNLHTV